VQPEQESQTGQGPAFIIVDAMRMIIHSHRLAALQVAFSFLQPESPSMSKSPRRLVLLPLALSIMLAACGGDDAAQQPPPPEVSVVTLAPQDTVLTRELPGRTTAYQIAEVRPQVSGIIERRLFTEGSMVQEGEPLYQLDDATYQAVLASAQAQLTRAEATLEAARLRAARTSELARIDAVSQQDDENATAALRQAEADVKAARAAVQSAQVNVGFARITAPITGQIGRSSVTQGALVTANQPQALATIQRLDPIYVDLTQSASELLELRQAVAAGTLERAEMPVTILLEDGTEYPHQGTLALSEVSVDPSTGSFAVRVVVDNPDQILMPGMYVNAIVGSGVRQNAILVPQQGIARDPKGNTSAMVVNDQGLVEVRPVRVSRAIGNKWLVEEGLAAGDRVIVEGLQKIQPGIPVQVVEAAGTPAAGAAGAAPDDGANAPADAPVVADDAAVPSDDSAEPSDQQ